ncbi:MAG: metallophosphoesterase [Verrucomicrobiota bacterium]|nr:metallophosphoesterase [Verrucomicrobiota bacterium]
MRTVVHISDLHFGRVNPAILEPLQAFVRQVAPSLVAVSGDLTQRARTKEYLAARQFLRGLPFPQIVVPGNHDVPLRNPFNRFVKGLTGYKQFISADLQPSFVDEEIAVVGVNTARALTWKNGRINGGQLERLRRRFEHVSSGHMKIVVTHHPFDLPAGAHGEVVGRSRVAIKTIAECKIDMLLAGHFHIAATGYTAKRYNIPGYSALIVSAGTSTSTRGRGQPNSLNVIRIAKPHVTIDRYTWHPETNLFDLLSSEKFQQSASGWIRE